MKKVVKQDYEHEYQINATAIFNQNNRNKNSEYPFKHCNDEREILAELLNNYSLGNSKNTIIQNFLIDTLGYERNKEADNKGDFHDPITKNNIELKTTFTKISDEQRGKTLPIKLSNYKMYAKTQYTYHLHLIIFCGKNHDFVDYTFILRRFDTQKLNEAIDNKKFRASPANKQKDANINLGKTPLHVNINKKQLEKFEYKLFDTTKDYNLNLGKMQNMRNKKFKSITKLKSII